jgi:hypothetical protein
MQVILLELPRNTPPKQPTYPPTQRTTHSYPFAHYPFAWQLQDSTFRSTPREEQEGAGERAATQGTAHTNECTWGGWVGAGADVCDYFEVRLSRA